MPSKKTRLKALITICGVKAAKIVAMNLRNQNRIANLSDVDDSAVKNTGKKMSGVAVINMFQIRC